MNLSKLIGVLLWIFLNLQDNIAKEGGKALNDVGSATSEALNEASKFTGEVSTESVKL